MNCPRCNGPLCVEQFLDGEDKVCVICGYRKYSGNIITITGADEELSGRPYHKLTRKRRGMHLGARYLSEV